VAARSNPAAQAERMLTIERTFDAPRSLVFACWTQKEHLDAWSCPRGYSISHSEGDLRPGGRWRVCMVAPDGSELWLGGVYRDIVPNELIVMTHVWDGEDGKPGHETLLTLRFEERGGKTKLTLHQAVFDSVESRDGHEGGWGEALDKLAEHMAAGQGDAP